MSTQAELGRDFFALFGLPRAFDLDVASLAARYRELQRQFHPDRFAQAPDNERRLSMQMTAHLNEAYQTLKDPLRRGRYLLRLAGIDTDDETDTVMDPAFLVEQMELRERLEEMCDDAAGLDAVARDIDSAVQDKIAGVASALTEGTPTAQRRARDLLREMQFLKKLAAEIETRQDRAL